MAMIKCKICGAMISDKATKCVECGCSIKEAKGERDNSEIIK